MEIEVVAERCIGSGNCVDIASDFFAQDVETGTALVREHQVPRDREDAVRDAAATCPVAAIVLHGTETGAA